MILELQHIDKTYLQGKMEVPVLKDISLSVDAGEYVAIMGPSGSGKTTLMNIIGCLDLPTAGTYSLAGENIIGSSESKLSEIRLNSIGFVFQSFHLLPRQSAAENVALPLLYAGVPRKQRRERAIRALERVGLDPGDRRTYRKYSLGMKQRLAIAQAIMESPDVIMLDEPTNGLDDSGVELIRKLIMEEKQRGAIVLLASHNRDDIRLLADRLYQIEAGELRELGAVS